VVREVILRIALDSEFSIFLGRIIQGLFVVFGSCCKQSCASKADGTTEKDAGLQAELSHAPQIDLKILEHKYTRQNFFGDILPGEMGAEGVRKQVAPGEEAPS